jgi:hypothetical protein
MTRAWQKRLILLGALAYLLAFWGVVAAIVMLVRGCGS